MSRLFTVVEKKQVLALLDGKHLGFVNNVGYSKSCADAIVEAAGESFGGLGSVLPCVWCEDDYVSETLTMRFPVNWTTHMFLMLNTESAKVFNLKHETLLELSALPEPCTTEETIAYRNILLSAIDNEFNLGECKDNAAMNFITEFGFGDIQGFLILDEDFDPHEDGAAMRVVGSRAEIEAAIKSSIFTK